MTCVVNGSLVMVLDVGLQDAPLKLPSEKFILIVTEFVIEFTVFTQEDPDHNIQQILLQYLILFKNYIYLNLKVHFS